MKKLMFAVIVCSFAAGCTPGMTRKSTIQAYKECANAGLNAEVVRDLDGNITNVQCFQRSAKCR